MLREEQVEDLSRLATVSIEHNLELTRYVPTLSRPVAHSDMLGSLALAHRVAVCWRVLKNLLVMRRSGQALSACVDTWCVVVVCN